jgi:signal transduction histidine kinase
VFDIAPREIAEVYHTKDLELFRNQGIQIYDSQVKDARGAIHDVVFHKSTFSDPKGHVLGLIGVILDITERKRAEDEREALRKQLFQAQKMEAIGTLTGGIAHDFNNLLTIINGYTELVLSEKTSDDPCHSDLQKVLETGRKGAELVQRLLALSKKAETNPQPLDLNRTVENSVALMMRTLPKMIEIETVLGKDLSLVNADAAQVDQVLMNLCINAKEAMPEGGKLRIETKNVIMDAADCKFKVNARPGPHVAVEVTDTGTGMDEETLGRLFDPFFTTKGWDFKKGTGLSLTVAKGIVEQHGGWITCESEPGKGTTFRIHFPAIVEAPTAEKPVLVPTTLAGSGRILLVDDEEYVRDLGKRILERANYTVIIAANGTEALEIYDREWPTIGLVILDLIMPQMSGEKCLEELYKINPYAKVVVSSGHSVDPNERIHLAARAKGFVNKPYQMNRLLEVVGEVLDAK